MSNGIKRQRETPHKEQWLSFVKKLWAADTLAMFHHPVSATEVPGYYDVVEVPMDLSKIRKKIEEDMYSTDAEVENDVALMLSNALDFNEKGSPWHDLAKKLKKHYPAIARESGLTIDADSVFIPTKKARDDESTLRKAEKEHNEKLEDVLEAMEREKGIPLEQLRAMYAHSKADGPSADYGSSRVSDDIDDSNEQTSSEEEDLSDAVSSSGSYDTDEEDSEDSTGSQSTSKDDDADNNDSE